MPIQLSFLGLLFLFRKRDCWRKIWLLPWDLDYSFQKKDTYIEDYGMPHWNENVPCETNPKLPGFKPASCDKLTRLIAATQKENYRKYSEDLLDNYYICDSLYHTIDYYCSLIDSTIQYDPQIDPVVWENDIRILKDDIAANREQFVSYIDALK